MQSSQLAIENDGDIYTATWDGEPAGELRLYDDEQGRLWLNFIEVETKFQRKGIGSALLKKAVQDNSEIYAAVGMRPQDESGQDDTRHLSTEGAALVNSAIRSGILQHDWCFNPTVGYGRDDDDY